MPTYYSTQMALAADIPSLLIDHKDVKNGMYRFNYTTPVAAAGRTVADIIQLQQIVDYGYFLMGLYWAAAMSTAGGDSSIQIGLLPAVSRTPNHGLAALVAGTGVPAYFLTTTSVDALTSATSFGATTALGHDTLLYPGDIIYATIITEAWAASSDLHGYFMAM